MATLREMLHDPLRFLAVIDLAPGYEQQSWSSESPCTPLCGVDGRGHVGHCPNKGRGNLDKDGA